MTGDLTQADGPIAILASRWPLMHRRNRDLGDGSPSVRLHHLVHQQASHLVHQQALDLVHQQASHVVHQQALHLVHQQALHVVQRRVLHVSAVGVASWRRTVRAQKGFVPPLDKPPSGSLIIDNPLHGFA